MGSQEDVVGPETRQKEDRGLVGHRLAPAAQVQLAPADVDVLLGDDDVVGRPGGSGVGRLRLRR